MSCSNYIPISHLSHQEVEGLVVALLPASAAKQPTTVQVTLLDKDTWGTFSAIFVATKRGVFLKETWGYFQTGLRRPKLAFSHGRLDHLHL